MTTGLVDSRAWRRGATAAPLRQALLTMALLAAGCGRTALLDGGGDGGPCQGVDCPPFLLDAFRPFPDGSPPFPDGFPPLPDGFPPFADGFPPQPDFGDCHQHIEICNNGIDDNCNGLIDCMDPQCAGDPACPAPGVEICNNGIDDDHNGLTDCDDPACKNFPGCQPHLCDLNHIDCKDPMCVQLPQCQNLVCKPSVDFGPLARNDARSERMVSTLGSKDIAQSACVNQPGGGQVATSFEVLENQTVVTLSFTQTVGTDTVFGLYRSGVNQACTANPVECFDPQAAPGGSHPFILDKGHYYLMAIANTRQHQGALDVVLSTDSSKLHEICHNGIDDNNNGLIDCADPECFADPGCVQLSCQADVDLGTLIPGQAPKKTTVDTTGGKSGLDVVQCGGRGRSRLVQFRVAETVRVHTIFRNRDTVSAGLYKVPAPGKACTSNSIECIAGQVPAPGINWEWDSTIDAGTYVVVVQTAVPGTEGPVDLTFNVLRPRLVELCHNGIDDDRNGFVDCADPACFEDPRCPPPVCAPDVDLGTLAVGFPAKSTVLDLRNGVPHEVVECAKGGGRSRVVQVKLDEAAGLAMSCNQRSGQAVLSVFSEAGARQACDENDLHLCGDPTVSPFGCGWIWPGLQPGIYYVIVQAFQAGQEGLFDLSLSTVFTKVPEICNNGIDDDMDGFTDCADRKCALSPFCLKKACKADATIDPMPIGGKLVQDVFDTRKHPPLTQPSCAASAGGGAEALLINLPQKATLSVAYDQTQQGGENNHVLAVYPFVDGGVTCDAGKELVCLPSMGLASGSLSIPNVPAGKYWVILAATKPGTEGPLILTLSAK